VTVIEDRDRTIPLWREYQRIVQEDQPFTFIYYETQANAVRRRLHDVQMDIRGTLLSVADWWIAPGDRRRPPGAGR
jgi:ABC-type transport system substrate-binding protein